MKTHVLHVINQRLAQGGILSYVLQNYQQINHEKIRFDFLVLEQFPGESAHGYHDDEVLALGSMIHRTPLARLRYIFSFACFLKKIIKENHYTVIHLHMFPPILLMTKIICFFAKIYGVKCRIIHSHAPIEMPKKLKDCVFQFIADSLPEMYNVGLACSDDAGKLMFRKKSFEVATNAINLNRFKNTPTLKDIVLEELHLPENCKIIGHVGRFDDNKNQSFLIDILLELKKLNPQTFLIIVGDGGTMSQLKEKTNRLKLDEFIFFTGSQSQTEKYYNTFDCFILPSILEGLGIVNIEAQACGVPCLMSDAVPPEAKILEQSAFLPLSAGASVWAAKVNEILQVPVNRETANKQVKDAGWDIKDAAQKLQNLYLS